MSLQKYKHITADLSEYTHFFLCNYKPRSSGEDHLSRSLLRFKSKLQIDIQAWIECSIVELEKVIDKTFIIVRALHSGELVATNSPLDLLGSKLAQALKCQYTPQLIRKTKTTKDLKSLNKLERVQELVNVYTFNSSEKFKDHHFLIIDDILTTGTTLNAVAETITSNTGNTNISFFTLALVDHTAQLNQSIALKGAGYDWVTPQGWIVSEDEPRYNELNELKRKILADSF